MRNSKPDLLAPDHTSLDKAIMNQKSKKFAKWLYWKENISIYLIKTIYMKGLVKLTVVKPLRRFLRHSKYLTPVASASTRFRAGRERPGSRLSLREETEW